MELKGSVARLQDFYVLSVMAPLGIFRRPFYFRETIEQMDYAGAGSFFIVFLVSLFIGMALSLQVSAELADLGLKFYTAKIVGLSVIKEIGPVAVALSFAGRVGSGMASELGSMVLGHQVDVMRVHGVSIMKKLVTPRVLSAIVMLPVLTVVGDAVALVGGYYIAVYVSHQSGSFYWSQIESLLNFESVFSTLFKPVVFGYLVSCISCYMGLSTRGGSRGLRKSTTTAVVLSTIMIILMDFVMTRILLLAFGATL
jgi:phospholipid/cholesterol/gamma-HCH transport system permease protein